MRILSILKANGAAPRPEKPADPAAPSAPEVFCAVLGSLQQHAVEIGSNVSTEYRNALNELRDAVREERCPVYEEGMGRLDDALKQHKLTVERFHAGREEQVCEILQMLGDATRALARRSDSHTDNLRTFATELDEISKRRNIDEIRQRLSTHVVNFKAAVQQMASENRLSVEAMSRQLKHFQDRLDRAEKLASQDELTGLGNRREATERIEERLGLGRKFCLVILDINDFKQINDTLGHDTGDRVLKAVAKNLRALVRADDTACRWGGDEFVVVADCDLASAASRARRLGDGLAASYDILLNGKAQPVRVSASIGAAEARPGESFDSLFSRADAALYKAKEMKKNKASGLFVDAGQIWYSA